MKQPAKRLDEQALSHARLEWEPDPDAQTWLRARHDGDWVYMRINPEFPDVPLYSLLVDVDETRELDDLPAAWSRHGPLSWPSDANR